jgi:hypothetical protein
MICLGLIISGVAVLIALFHFGSYCADRKFKHNPYFEMCQYCFSDQSAFMMNEVWCCRDCAKKCICGNLKLPDHVTCDECFKKC